MPNNNKALRLKALAREQRFVEPMLRDKEDEEKIKKYVESFTEKLIQQQKKIHLLLTDLFIQEIKLISILEDPRYKAVIGLPFMHRGNPLSQNELISDKKTVSTAKSKYEQNEIHNYLKYLSKCKYYSIFIIKYFSFKYRI